MKIVHLTASIGRRSGGLGAVALGLSLAQRDLGHSPTIWCMDRPEELTGISQVEALREAVRSWPTLGPRSVGFAPQAERMARRDVGRCFEVLHQHGIWMANSRVSAHWRRATGRPTVISPGGALDAWALGRSWFKKQLALLAYEKENLGRASCLHATCVAEAGSFRRFGLRNPIAVVPLGIDRGWLGAAAEGERFRRGFGIPSKKKIMLFLARLHPGKGIPLLIEAIADQGTRLRDWLLVVAGAEEVGHRRVLEDLIQARGLQDAVRFVGPVFGTMKRDAFAAADLYVLPTYSENFAITVVEALGAGVPVLTTHGAPWRELVTERCGWWVDIDAAALGAALREVAACGRETLAAMGERGRLLVANKYTWPRVAAMTIELYEWLLGMAAPPEFVIPSDRPVTEAAR